MLKRFVLPVALTVTLTTACAAPGPTATPIAPPTASAQTLTVFAAASLTEAFTEIGNQFETAHSGVTVSFNFGASNQLAEQINQGAPVDVFASANAKQMTVSIDGGRIISGTEQTFVKNRLVVIFPKENPGGVNALADLAKPDLKLVLATKEVPVGQYALVFLDKAVEAGTFGATFKEDVLKNVVSYEENVKAVFSKVALGEADGGIVYTTDITGSEADKVASLDIPDSLNTIAAYPIAPLQDSAQVELAQAFVNFVLSAPGQDILAQSGFITVNK